MQIAEVKQEFSIDNVVPFFQPIMDLQHNSVSSYECLARLMSFEQKAYLPSDFLHLIERQDRVSELTQTIFNRSANYFRHLNTAWNVNVSQKDMSDPAIHQFFRAQVTRYPNPQRVAVEVTAANALHDQQVFERFSQVCQGLGMKVVIDHVADNLEQTESLLDYPIAAIKFSASVLLASVEDNALFQRIQSWVKQAGAKGISIIAEHVESEAMLEAAKALNIRYAQGFYFSQPQAKV